MRMFVFVSSLFAIIVAAAFFPQYLNAPGFVRFLLITVPTLALMMTGWISLGVCMIRDENDVLAVLAAGPEWMKLGEIRTAVHIARHARAIDSRREKKPFGAYAIKYSMNSGAAITALNRLEEKHLVEPREAKLTPWELQARGGHPASEWRIIPREVAETG